jgi:flagellar basal body P-ring formation protein FlgA
MVRSTLDVSRALRRIVARRTAAWLVCAVAGAGWASAALAQEAGAPIVIPGPGETNSADLAKMTAIATSSAGSNARAANPVNAANAASGWVRPAAAPATTDRFSALANASGAIVIAGPGEAPAAVIPPLPRVNQSPSFAASQGVPVIVSTAPPRAANPAAERPVDAAPASGFQIDSLASRGEPPELGASAPSRNPPSRTAAAQTQAQTQTPSAAQILAQAVQRAQVIQSIHAAQTTPAAQALQAGQPVPAGQEDGETIRAAALDFLKQQANGLPGHVELTVAPAFPRGLAACATLQPFMPNGARLWGRTTVGVRCTSGHPWTVWLQAKVSVHATYYVAAHAMLPGQVISDADLVGRDGDLTMLPMSIITAPSQALGSITLTRVGAGLPLRQDMLKNAASVTAGTTVRVVAQGEGFSISSEGSALSNATPGQPVRVRTTAGQIITGIVKDSSTVQIQM